MRPARRGASKGVFRSGERSGPDIVTVLGDGVDDGFPEVGVRFGVPRGVAGVDAQQVVEDEDLSVASSASADTDGGNAHGRGDFGSGFGRDTFEDDREGAGMFRGLGVGQQLAFVALHAVAAELMNALWPKSAMGHYRNASGNEPSDYLRLLHSALKLDRLAPRLLEDAAGVFDGLMDAQMEAGERHVDDDQRMAHRAAYEFGMVDHFLQRDRQGVGMALNDHRKAIAHENTFDVGSVDQPGKRVVVRRNHRDFPPCGFHGGELGDGNLSFFSIHRCGGLKGNAAREQSILERLLGRV